MASLLCYAETMILLGSIERSELQTLLQRHISPERRRLLHREMQQKLSESPYDGHSKGPWATLPKLKHESFAYVDEDEDADEKGELPRPPSPTPSYPEEPNGPTSPLKQIPETLEPQQLPGMVTSGMPQPHPSQLVEASMLTVCTCLCEVLVSQRLREGPFSAVPVLKVLCECTSTSV
ncbi:PREDICTED: chloride channel protein 1-like [Calidris pugnax]|uniref:chloride channel protein 1-like n=1 Tax=Calidris pugnax TaxID=198806 RepID=UPI00071E029C|nr:PREDICTED: chloride channel protein 1-like [Calidris pugnax]